MVAADYEYQTYDERTDSVLSFRQVEMDRDLGRLHQWLGNDHVKPYWDLDEPLPAFRETLAGKLDDDHLTPYLGFVDHVPMAYFERYWAIDDPVGKCYDADPADQGAHTLFGPPEFVGAGYARPLFEAFMDHMFAHPETDRLVAEPDVRNEAVIHLAEECGFEPQRRIDHPEKEALLLFCERFEREVRGDRVRGEAR